MWLIPGAPSPADSRASITSPGLTLRLSILASPPRSRASTPRITSSARTPGAWTGSPSSPPWPPRKPAPRLNSTPAKWTATACMWWSVAASAASPPSPSSTKCCWSEDPRRVTPFLIPMMLADMGSAQVSMVTGAMGANYCITSSCSSGADAIGTGWDLIRHGKADVVLAGGAEAPGRPALSCRIQRPPRLVPSERQPSGSQPALQPEPRRFRLG